MKHQYISTAKSHFNPCVIEHLPRRNLFIIGTYELVEKDSPLASQYTDLVERNYRLGSLELFDPKKAEVSLVYECPFGGVFDLRVVTTSALSSFWPEESDLLIVAHANGVLALYQVRQEEIILLEHWKTTSSMLTTVQDSFDLQAKTLSFFAGGATGILSQLVCSLPEKLTHLSQGKLFSETELTETSITENEHPIWFIRTYQVRSSDHQSDTLVLIASEDSKWRIHSTRTKRTLYTNCDAKAGITSFEFASDSSKSDSEIRLFVGSYDEYLRIYTLPYTWKRDENDEDDDSGLSLASTTLLYKLHIDGGGIWRIKSFEASRLASTLLISAMYSGVHFLSLHDDWTVTGTGRRTARTEAASTHRLLVPDRTDNVTKSEEKLIYGVASDPSLSTILFASFYEKEIYLFAL